MDVEQKPQVVYDSNTCQMRCEVAFGGRTMNEAGEGMEYTELGIPVTEDDGSRQGEYLLRVYDQMLNNAETNFFKRPIIQTFDNEGHKTGWLAIPTLEDLKCALYEAGNSTQDLGLPEKVVNMHDIETAAYISDSPLPLRSLQALASRLMAMVTSTFNSYKNECNHFAGTIKIFDLDRLTELSLVDFFMKYYEGVH